MSEASICCDLVANFLQALQSSYGLYAKWDMKLNLQRAHTAPGSAGATRPSSELPKTFHVDLASSETLHALKQLLSDRPLKAAASSRSKSIKRPLCVSADLHQLLPLPVLLHKALLAGQVHLLLLQPNRHRHEP